MFLLIYVWFFFLKIVDFFSITIQRMYWIVEQPSILYSRDFYNLGYLEKLFLSLFYKDDQFLHSIANVHEETDIFGYRQKHYPHLFFYGVWLEKCDYVNTDILDFVKLYKYLKNSFFFKKFILTKNIFDETSINNEHSIKYNNFIFFLVFDDLTATHYYSNINYLYYDNNINETKFTYFFIVLLFLQKCNKKVYFFDLNFYTDWYNYNFNQDLKKKQKKIFFSKFNIFMKKKMRFKKKYNFMKYFLFYHVKYKLVKIYLSVKMNLSKVLKNSFSPNNSKIELLNNYKNNIINFYKIKFKDSSNLKNITYKNLNNYSFFFLRKNKIFNKGRYSRNRQLYRTGVYWCLWLNIIVVYGLYFLFYRFSFNFGYIWLGVGVLILSTILGRVLKYNFHNIFFLKNELFFFKNWLSFLILNFVELFENLFINFFKKTVFFYFYRNKRKLIFYNNFFIKIYYYFIFFLKNFFINVKKTKRIYIWEIMIEPDDSFLRYKTVFYYMKQIYKSITY